MKPAFLALSAILAVAYGLFGAQLYASGSVPHAAPVALKASGIAMLAALALVRRSRLLAIALLFGAAGDALLAWSEQAFLYGALAFLIGHLCYIALFLRSGVGVSGLKREPLRLAAMCAVAGAAMALNGMLAPASNALSAPLMVYTLVLTAMTVVSFTLPASRWLAMAGAILFLISDGFVAAQHFHADSALVSTFWFGFVGWMLYWAGQAGLCVGALGLPGPPRAGI